MKTKKLIIVGDSSTAEIAYEYFQYDSEFEVIAFSVEKAFLRRNSLFGLPVYEFEKLEKIINPEKHYVFVATVYTSLNRLRTRLAYSAKNKGFKLASYISSHAFIWRNVKIGEHCFILENNTLQPFVEIGNNVILWSGNHIGHHSVINDNCFISSQVVISGFCIIGENSFIGVNSSIANNITIAKDNWLGPNSTIIKNTKIDSLIKSNNSEPSKISSTRFFKISK